MEIPPNPSKVVVSVSFGKDSVAMLLKVLELFPKNKIICHHQIIEEDWEGTLEYGQELCRKLGVQLFTAQAYYIGYECINRSCKERWTSAVMDDKCPECRTKSGFRIKTIRSLTDLIEWRGMWPDMKNRYCTSYLKVMVFNRWVRENRGMLGLNPVVATGERWAESSGRAKLPYLRPRTAVDCGDFHMQDWKPILHYSRRESFRAHRAAGIEPHPCYKQQGMTDYDMYEVNAEGGPRMSCRCCIFNTPAQIKTNAEMPQNKELFGKLVQIEHVTKHTFKENLSIQDILDNKHIKEAEKLQLRMELC